MKIELSKLELEILEHRIDVPDAIAECLSDSDHNLKEAEVLEAIETIKILDDGIWFNEDDAKHSIVKNILWDISLDEAYIDSAGDNVGADITHQKYTAIEKAYFSMRDKLQNYLT